MSTGQPKETMEEKIIEAREISVNRLFSDDFMFNIPFYQRPLAWNLDRFEQLIEDIRESMSTEEGHFLGSILLQQKSHRRYDLVDGQQRMVALTILMAVIRDMTDTPGLKETMQSCIYTKANPYRRLPETMRVTPWEELQEIFREYIYSPGGTQKYLDDFDKIDYKDTEDPKYHLYEAIDTFGKQLRVGVPDLGSFVAHMLNNVYMVHITTKSDLNSAFRLFHVMNTRGLELSPSDILKAENLGIIKENEKKEQYARIWRSIEEELGRETLADIVAFIRTMKKKEKARLGIYEEYQEIFRKHDLERGTKFIDYVKEIADIYEEKILSTKITLANLEQRNRYAIIMDLMDRFIPFSDWVPPLLAFHHKFKSEEYLLDFVLKLEKKVIVEWAVGFSATKRITSLNKIIKMIEEIDDPKLAVDKMLVPKADEDTKRVVVDFGKSGEVKKLLKSALDDTQFYSMRGGKFAKYILLRTDMESWDLENFPGYKGVHAITVEHVLPQTPSEASEWVNIFNEEERDEWANKFGNLVLLSGRKNSRAQNYDFDKKKEVYFKEKSTPFKITQELQSIARWTLENLKNRHNTLVSKVIGIYSQ